MFKRLLRRRPAPGTIMGGLALFITLGGVGYAATGGNFLLGNANTAGNTSALSSGVTTGPTLSAVNTGGKSAARFTANAGIAPFSVSNTTKIGNLNADLLDGLDSTSFLRSDHLAADTDSGTCTADSGRGICAIFTLGLAHPGRLLLNATGSWYTVRLDDDSGPGSATDDPLRVQGFCRFYVDNAPIVTGQYMGERHPSSSATPTHLSNSPGTMGLTALSQNLGAGLHSAYVACTESDGNLNWFEMSLTGAVVDDASAP
jgi:hypothetical protein